MNRMNVLFIYVYTCPAKAKHEFKMMNCDNVQMFYSCIPFFVYLHFRIMNDDTKFDLKVQKKVF